MRIATDLHDDIGSTLSQISVLSEVIRRKAPENPDVVETLSSVIGLSRDLIDSLNDIVWAINPNRDSLDDLTHRMRRFASDLASARGVELQFRGPAAGSMIKLGADLRRETFLVFKESVNNAMRHAACTRIDVQFAVSNRWIELTVVDNGKGFEANGNGGNGLASMDRRALRLGKVLKVTSGLSAGTAVALRAPTEPRRGF